ncbi:MAG: ribonuclease H-like domain-containing protein [Lentisphaerae bacterium]|nr:ribonuclease H-like domain-containing protein [Lentisphaerota bacterium]
MLQNTILHLYGIGEATEKHLWQQGIATWADYLALQEAPARIRNPADTADGVRESLRLYAEGCWDHFDKTLPAAHKWRAYGDLRERTLFLDIETDGLHEGSVITVIGVYDGHDYRSYINGQNLEEACDVIEGAAALVTYNGAAFDLPVIRRRFPLLRTHCVHIDLRFPLHRMGFKGGLKTVEKAFRLERSEPTRNLNGWDAVRLWRDYENGHEGALRLLLEYNREDVLHLKPLMEHVAKELGRGLPA